MIAQESLRQMPEEKDILLFHAYAYLLELAARRRTRLAGPANRCADDKPLATANLHSREQSNHKRAEG